MPKSKKVVEEELELEDEEDEDEDSEEDETEEPESDDDEETEDEDEDSESDDDEDESPKKKKRKGTHFPGKGTLVPREPVKVTNEIYKSQPKDIQELLKQREALQAKGDKKGLRAIRMKLRAKGFRLSSINNPAAAKADKVVKAKKAKKSSDEDDE